MNKYIKAKDLLDSEIARCHCVPVVGSNDDNYKDLEEILAEMRESKVLGVDKLPATKALEYAINGLERLYRRIRADAELSERITAGEVGALIDAKQILEDICEYTIEPEQAVESELAEEATARWEYWSGWSGNHDKRIEDAQCSNCGFKHSTVRGKGANTPDLLADRCPRCRRLMIKRPCK